MAASTLDDVVFVIDNDSRSVTVIDGGQDRPTAVISNVGHTPTLAESAPVAGS